MPRPRGWVSRLQMGTSDMAGDVTGEPEKARAGPGRQGREWQRTGFWLGRPPTPSCPAPGEVWGQSGGGAWAPPRRKVAEAAPQLHLAWSPAWACRRPRDSGTRWPCARAGRALWRDSSRTSSVRTKAAVRPRVPGPGSSAEEPAGPATGRVRATRWTRELSSQGRQGDARTRPLGSRCRRGRPFRGEGGAGQALGPQRGGTTWVLASETQATSARCLGATRQGQEVWRGQERCPLKRSASVPRPSSLEGRPRCDQGPGARRPSVSAERSGATCHGAVSGAADSRTQPLCCDSGSVRHRRAVNYKMDVGAWEAGPLFRN